MKSPLFFNHSRKSAGRVGVVLAVLAALLSASCSSDSDDDVDGEDGKSLSCDADRNTSPELGEAFALPEGDVVQIADQQIFLQFVSVVSDSRCPIDSTCIMAGDITIELSLTADGNAAELLDIATVYDTTTTVESQGYTLALSDVTPHPQSGVTIAQGTHCATLSVSKTPVS